MKRLSSIFSNIWKDIHSIRHALIILLPYMLITQISFHTICPFAILTGFPCPGCGLTRAAIFAFTGQLHAAANINATVFLWLPLALYVGIFRYLLCRKPPLLMPLTTVVGLITIGYFALRLSQGITVPIPCKGILPLLWESVSPSF